MNNSTPFPTFADQCLSPDLIRSDQQIDQSPSTIYFTSISPSLIDEQSFIHPSLIFIPPVTSSPHFLYRLTFLSSHPILHWWDTIWIWRQFFKIICIILLICIIIIYFFKIWQTHRILLHITFKILYNYLNGGNRRRSWGKNIKTRRVPNNRRIMNNASPKHWYSDKKIFLWYLY